MFLLPFLPQPRHPDGRLPGQVHYENLCMKAVNQSIGRSIRHSRDYACIVLVDQRYERGSVKGKLPEWIGTQLQICLGFGQAFAAVRKVCRRVGVLCTSLIPRLQCEDLGMRSPHIHRSEALGFCLASISLVAWQVISSFSYHTTCTDCVNVWMYTSSLWRKRKRFLMVLNSRHIHSNVFSISINVDLCCIVFVLFVVHICNVSVAW